ncbi:DUF350 domain-containing protein [Caldanaerobius polysaccharolyticus]|uniref:DUF350 domain-containing protein n=1 Tax=Caldanaerobius polysaccharolyticus TaxID=44256 RepID=UPI00055801D8|nr:DUF350 domain-containing protein [Caldanaerobius polysaccharolyticus]
MNLWDQILSTLIFGFIGIFLMGIAYKIMDRFIPADLNKGIEEGNLAAGVVIAGIFIGIGIIVAYAIA